MRRVLSAMLALTGAAAFSLPNIAAAQHADHATQPTSTDVGKIPITTRSSEARTLYLRARALNETLKTHDAHEVFVQAVALDPNFAMGEYYLASTSPSAKESHAHVAKSVALLNGVSPGERLMILGLQARANADRSRARQLAESLVVLYPNDERAHFVLGSIYSAQKLYREEIAQFEKAIALNPSYSLAYNQIGYAYRAVDDTHSAESSFQKYIALIPDDPNPHDSYAELLLKMGRFDASIAEYKKALAIDPHFGASHIGIAANEWLSGRTNDAIKELENYYNVGRDDSERRSALANEAMLYADRGATDDAVRLMEKSRDIAAAAGDIANVAADESSIGDILLESGRIDAAVLRYARVHEAIANSTPTQALKDDDALTAHYEQARVSLARHQVAQARSEATAYAQGSAARKNDFRIRQSRALNGLVALEAKEYDAALSELASADQDDPAVLYAMSRAAAGKGDATKASALASQALHLNILPTFSYAFTRAALASATGAASSRSVRGTRN